MGWYASRTRCGRLDFLPVPALLGGLTRARLSPLSHGCHATTAAPLFHDGHTTVTRLLHECYSTVTRLLLGSYMTRARFSGARVLRAAVKTKARPVAKPGGYQPGSTSSLFAPSARRGASAEQFGIVHYGGEVLYTATGWLDKNRLSMPTELSLLMLDSKSSLLQVTAA